MSKYLSMSLEGNMPDSSYFICPVSWKHFPFDASNKEEVRQRQIQYTKALIHRALSVLKSAAEVGKEEDSYSFLSDISNS